MNDYRLFGLAIRSEIALPELSAVDTVRVPDLVIRVGALPAGLPSAPGFHPLERGGLLVIEGVGRYLALAGRELVVEPVAGVPERNLRLFLLGSAMGLLMHQRGLLPLHANAVVIDGRAFAFTGPSGVGKSTLAAWFAQAGYPLLSDDVCAIGVDADGVARVFPGLPRLRLWRDAIERSGREVGSYARSFEDADDFDKYDVPLPSGGLASEPAPLGGVILLERGENAGLEALAPAAAMEVLFGNIYRGEYLSAGEHERVWRTCLALASRLPVLRWTRSWRLDHYAAEVAVLLDAIRARSGR
ncbi:MULTISPECIES: hypothetical protein [Sphingomonas]|uniref:hypothetical protein n=1 Tax=Sphingomonas TaxID=13687 RepID=UPI000DEEE0CF|nr:MULTISPECIES: hypothetical protein [Sphingomonas]